MSQWPKLMQKAEDFRHKLKKIATSKPYDAIELICMYWYYSYAKEKELDIGKADILYSLAVREESISGFLTRLDQLPRLIESYQCTDENHVILSTIHSAKGLEFDTVYIVDVYDGSLPHSSKEDAKEQERIDTYEEERRIFYVAITRAKNELYLLYISNYGSSFINEIAPPMKPVKSESTARSHTDYHVTKPSDSITSNDEMLTMYTVNVKVKHATYGEGFIIGLEKKRDDIHVIEVLFNDGSKSKLHLEVVVGMGLLCLSEEQL